METFISKIGQNHFSLNLCILESEKLADMSLQALKSIFKMTTRSKSTLETCQHLWSIYLLFFTPMSKIENYFAPMEFILVQIHTLHLGRWVKKIVISVVIRILKIQLRKFYSTQQEFRKKIVRQLSSKDFFKNQRSPRF